MIYEANKDLVPLEKEVDYIRNYMSLQLLRLKDSSNVKINIHGNLNFSIEPLLLISFIASINQIHSVQRNRIIIDDKRIPIGFSYKNEFIKKIDC